MHATNVRVTSGRLSMLLRVAGCALAILLARTYVASPIVPLTLKLVVVAIGGLAAFRPTAALLAVAAVVPFGRIISSEIFHVDASARFSEAFVLAFLAGWLLSRLRRGAGDRGLWPGSVSAMLFGATLVASVLVELGVLRYWKDYWGPYLMRLASYFGRDYLTLWIDARAWIGDVNGLLAPQAAALFLMGLALMWVVHLACARDERLLRRVVYVSLGAGAGAAVLSLGLAAVRWTASEMDLLTFVTTRRLSLHTTKVNAAASHFVLFVPIALAVLWDRLRRGHGTGSPAGRLAASVSAAAALALLAALFMTGSRAALLAAIAVLAVVLAVSAVSLLRRRHWRFVGVVATIAAIGIGMLALGLSHRDSEGARAWYLPLTLEIRMTMWKYAAETAADRPVFGVGVGQFRSASAVFRDDPILQKYWGLYWRNGGFPAHNHFLEMTAELGMVGGALFAAMFAGILWRGWTAFRRSQDVVLGGVVAGLGAFLITCLAGNPLAVEVVAHPFWIMLGVALAAGAGRGGRPEGVGQPWPGDRWRRRLVVGFLVALAVSVPIRVWQGAKDVNYALVDYGLADGWSVTGDDRDFKLVQGDATFFVYGRTYWLDVPVRRDPQSGSVPVNLEIRFDGRIARQITLDGDTWQTVGFMIPPDPNRPYRRIDLRVTGQGDADAMVRLGRPDAKRR